MQELAQQLSNLAKLALYQELETYPKPGLVSHIDNGSHTDMDHAIFLRSIDALGSYFHELVMAGINNVSFDELKLLAIAAETRMLKATNGINTHRGAIFIFGLLIPGLSYLISRGLDSETLSATIIKNYSADLSTHKPNPASHGSKIREQYQLEGIIDSAGKGFPLIFAALEELSSYMQLYTNETYIRLKLFFYIMQHLDDTNLVYRGGIDALKYAKIEAAQLSKIECNKMQYDAALSLHHDFIRKNLSPGGSADVFAAVVFLDMVRQIWD
ncbi:MAG: triphosphoribosyl-dephospho-CoA synthase MdcB [Neisseriales bacterium]|nr:MAG: triphosphoribosyl-dephospho-CoA synthase MdcB [Neisseriales bacterium]